MDNNKPLLPDKNKANWLFCVGHIEDSANAIVLAALDARLGNRIYNVGVKDAYSEMDSESYKCLWMEK